MRTLQKSFMRQELKLENITPPPLRPLTSPVLLHESDQILVVLVVVLVRLGLHRDVHLSLQVQEDPLRQKVVRPVVLPQVVEDHHGPGRPVEVRVQDVGEVPQLGGGRPAAHDGPVFVALVEAVRGSTGGDQREFPVGRETPHGGQRVYAPGSEESVRTDVKLGVHGHHLRPALGARPRDGVLGAVVQDVHVTPAQQPVFTVQVLVRHEDGREDARQSPRVLVVVVREHHRHGYVTSAAGEEAAGQRGEQAASQRASASHIASQPLESPTEESMGTESAPLGEETRPAVAP